MTLRGKNRDKGRDALRNYHARFLFCWVFHSAFATFINKSSSLMAIQEVSAFMAFSKSESNKTSRRAWMSAALVAWRTSRPLLLGVCDVDGCDADDDPILGVGRSASSWPRAASPRSRYTSHTRNWAGNGIDRLNKVKYHRVPYAVLSMQRSALNGKLETRKVLDFFKCTYHLFRDVLV